MEDLEAQVRQEVEQVVTVVSELTGLPSWWSASLELVEEAAYKALKSFSCTIRVNRAVVLTPNRWRALIHEALHSVSAGLNFSDYQRYRGWEEAVVEQTQRLLRPAVLARLGVAVEDAVFRTEEERHQFNPYIDALETLRSLLGGTDALQDREAFYLKLLAVPLGEGSQSLLQSGYRLPFTQRVTFVTGFSRANHNLTRRLP